MGTSRVQIATDERGVSRPLVNQSVPATTVLASAVLGKKHRLASALLTLSADGTIQFAGSTSGPLTGPMDIAAKGGFRAEDLGDIVQTAPGEDLQIITTGGAARGVVRVVTEA
jgi:hypothetical protein